VGEALEQGYIVIAGDAYDWRWERPGSKAIVIARDACDLTIRRPLHTAVFHPLQTALHQL